MENQRKASLNGMEGVESNGKDAIGEAKPVMGGVSDLLLRLLALGLTLVAAVLAGVGKQTKVVPIKPFDALPPLKVPVTAKWHYLSAIVYFVVANAIACAYTALSLLLTVANSGSKGLGTLIIVLDALMVALLFSGIGAALGVGVIGSRGNSHLGWNKVCNVFGKLCDEVGASIFISLVASIIFVLLVVVRNLRIHRQI